MKKLFRKFSQELEADNPRAIIPVALVAATIGFELTFHSAPWLIKLISYLSS